MQATPRRGFTLIEMLIVVAVAGILSAIALPSYHEYVRRSARSEARAGLLAAAQWMERAAVVSGVYPTTDANGAHFFPAGLQRVDSSRYTIGLSTSTPHSFTLNATPQRAQAGDRCGTYTLTHHGMRGNSDLAAGLTSADCWSR